MLNFTLYFFHIIASVFLILVVLLQQGKGADLSVFGGGSTQAAFGARGAATMLHKLTVGAFVIFTLTTLSISLFGGGKSSVTSGLKPAAPAAATTTAPEPAPSTSAPATVTTAPADAGTGQAPAVTEPPATPPPADGTGSGT